MKKSRQCETEMVNAVRQLESGVSGDVIEREHGISRTTLYKWKAKYSGMDVSQVRRLKELEEENRKTIFTSEPTVNGKQLRKVASKTIETQV